MQILSVISSMNPQTGGPAELVRNLSALLKTQGHEPAIACCDGSAGFGVPGVRSFSFERARGTFGYSRGLSQWLSLNVRDYDAVLVHGLWQYPGIAVNRSATKAKIPYWVLAHGMLDPYFNNVSPLKKAKKSLYWPLQHRVLVEAEAVLFTAEDERRLAAQSFAPYNIREKVIPYGTVAPPEEAPSQIRAFEAEFPEIAGQRFLLYLGRLHSKKGCDLLIRGFSEISGAEEDLHLVMAGPDSNGYLAELRSIVRSLSLEHRVHFTGMVSGAAKWGMFRSAELFALTSHQENFGIAVAESLACGVPVVVTQRVNIWREIVDSGAGFAPEDTQEGVTKALESWCEIRPSQRKLMSEKAISCFKNNFRLERTCESLLAELERVSCRGRDTEAARH